MVHAKLDREESLQNLLAAYNDTDLKSIRYFECRTHIKILYLN